MRCDGLSEHRRWRRVIYEGYDCLMEGAAEQLHAAVRLSHCRSVLIRIEQVDDSFLKYRCVYWYIYYFST